MASSFTTILLVVLLIAVIWLLLRVQTAQVEPMAHDHHEGEHHAEAHPAEKQPAMEHHEEAHAESVHATPAAPAVPDDLTVLEGVGPKVQSVLQAAGIMSFAQLADAPQNLLRDTLDVAGYKYMDPASWPGQARLAAAGDWEGLKAMQDMLSGGRS